MKITDLKLRNSDFDKIAEYHQDEWSHLYDKESLEGRKKRMEKYLSDNFIPSMFVGKKDNEIIGTSAIVECDLDTRPNLSPWLAAVFVFPEFRGEGYSKKLVRHVMEQAKKNGISKLYLYTEDADKLYAKLGWQEIDREEYLGNDIVIMEAEL